MSSDLTPKAMIELDGMEILLQLQGPKVKAIDWVSEHQHQINQLLEQRGALLVRGLNIMSSKQFGQILTTLFGQELADYAYRSTPRTGLKGNVYTATEYHPAQTIAQHNECAYANKWAMKLGFLCLLPASSGGATPIADSRLIYQDLPDALVAKFTEKKVMYVRNYANVAGQMDLCWQEVFQTEDPDEVAEYCAQNRIECQFKPDGALRTSQVLPAVARHPQSGERVWFNQAHLFHPSALPPEQRQSLLQSYSTEQLPRNALFGDGSVIDEADLETIRQVIDRHTLSFSWQAKDLLLLDNMKFTHGRLPYEGQRKVLVGMAQEYGHDFG